MSNHQTKIVLIVGFVLGVIFTAVAGKVVLSQKSFISKVFGKLEEYRVAMIPKKTQEQVLCDFEKPKELKGWETGNAEIFLSKENATSGQYSAKAVFSPAKDSGIRFSEFFNKNRKLSNWEGYDSFGVDIFNSENKPVTLHIKIQDRGGRSYNDKLFLAPETKTRVVIGVPQLRSRIKPNRIKQIVFFLWNNNKTRTLYFDNLKLIPQKKFGRGLVILDKENIPKRNEKIYEIPYDNFGENRQKWTQTNWIVFPIFVNNPTGGYASAFPVSGGIPLPRGEVEDLKDIRVYDQDRKPVPFQVRPLGYWPDRSFKWVQVDAQANLVPSKPQFFYLAYADDLKEPKFDSPLKVDERSSGITVETGPLKFSVMRGGFHLFDKIWLDQNDDRKFSDQELISEDSDLVIVHRGKEYRSSNDKKYSLIIEEQGPMKVTLKAEGWFVSKKKKEFCKFVTRIQAFAGKDYVKVFHTFIYTGYPENKEHYLYKGKRLPPNETIEAIYVETPYRMKGDLSYAFAADGNSMTAPLGEPAKIFQDSSENFTVKINDNKILSGSRLDGWVDVASRQWGLSVAVKNLWQQFPKGWEFDPKGKVLKTMIWPSWAGDLDLKTTSAANGEDAVARGSAFGLAKTHEMSFYFHKGPLSQVSGWPVLGLLTRSFYLAAEPQWLYDTNAIGKVPPKGSSPAEETVEGMFDWAARHIKDFKWYGMIDFGDTLSWYRNGGWHPDGRWGWMNNYGLGLHSGSLKQFLRTGEQSYLELGENAALHIMDVDTVHYNTVANDGRLKRTIGDEYSQVGSQHLHNANHWGGRNEVATHTNLHGILLYYYMTGYERAKDVALEIGDFLLKEPITYFRHPDIAPQRGIANVMMGTIELYELTSDEKYKKTADKMADILFKGQRYDGTWGEEYNPITTRWSEKLKHFFTADWTLPALVAYHRVTGNKAIAQSIQRSVDFYIINPTYEPYFEALVYSYYLSGDAKYLANARKRLDFYHSSQRRNQNPLENGMIFQKPYYVRPVEFLYQLPHAIEAINRQTGREKVK